MSRDPEISQRKKELVKKLESSLEGINRALKLRSLIKVARDNGKNLAHYGTMTASGKTIFRSERARLGNETGPVILMTTCQTKDSTSDRLKSREDPLQSPINVLASFKKPGEIKIRNCSP